MGLFRLRVGRRAGSRSLTHLHLVVAIEDAFATPSETLPIDDYRELMKHCEIRVPGQAEAAKLDRTRANSVSVQR